MKRAVGTLIAIALVAAGCGGGGEVTVDDVWARTSPSLADAGAVYMTITGGDTEDRLVAVSVPAEVAAVAQVHETSADDAGMMSMQEVGEIDVPAGGTLMLEPGGYHVMLMQLAEPLVTGATFEVTLSFESAGDMTVSVEVREG